MYSRGVSSLEHLRREAEILGPDPATNRLTSLGWAPVTYDAAGSLTSRDNLTFTWDPFAMLQRIQGPGLDRSYLYTADDERLAVIDQQLGGVETWRERLISLTRIRRLAL